MSQVNKYTSWLILAVFCYILTPAALIHEFHGHEDTHCLPGKLASVSIQHVHCKLLQIEAQIFTFPDPVILKSVPGINSPVSFAQPASPSCATVLFTDLRAPPAV